MASIHLDADSENTFFSIISELIIALGFQNGSEREFDLNLEEENGNKLEFSLENEFSPKSTVIPIKTLISAKNWSVKILVLFTNKTATTKSKNRTSNDVAIFSQTCTRQKLS